MTTNAKVLQGLDADVGLQKGNHEHLGEDHDPGHALHKIKTAGSISISPELFEKLYLGPRDAAASSQIRRLLGNPTPLALGGFLLALTPLSNDLMGWRGAGKALGAASIAAYLFFGGVLMVVGGVLEILVGNTFPAVVFGTFGAFWLTYGGTLQDGVYGAQSAYAQALPDGTKPTALEAMGDFYDAFSFVLLWMGVLCFIFLVCSVRTNFCFFMIFFTLVFAFSCLAGSFWQMAQGNMALGMRLTTAGGAFAFVTCVFGWYLFAAILLGSVDFPIELPVGDLSGLVKGKKELDEAKEKV